ncbi:MAG: hypothetical protein FJ137_03575 [Deltaproteobacteria bacterium]|nr:hypothetical protein [Deltaproteobacteria bacterium]
MRSPTPLAPLLLLVVVGDLAACEVVVADNPFDAETPADLQAPATLRGRIVLRDGRSPEGPVGERDALSTITIALRDGQGRLLERDGAARTVALVGVDTQAEDDAGAGRFVIDDLVPGQWTIVVQGVPAAYAAASPPTVTLGPGVDVDLGDVEFTYTVDDDGPYGVDGVVETSGPGGGLPRVSLFVQSPTGPRLAATTAVAGGAFRFEGLFSGTYAVVVEGDAVAPAYRLDLPVGASQPQTSFVGDQAITLRPVTAVLLPITTGADGVVVAERTNYVRDLPVPVALLSFATDVAADVGVNSMRVSADPLFRDDAGDELGFGPYAASAAVPLPAVDGPHTIHAQFQATSPAGFAFTSPVFTLDVVRDTAPPRLLSAALTGLAVVDGVALAASRTVALRTELQDDTSAVAALGVGLDVAPDTLELVVGGSGVVRNERSVTFGADGEHQVFVVARDRAGNQTDVDVAALRVLVDTVAPDITLDVENAPGGVLAERIARLRVASRDAADDILVAVGVEGELLVATAEPGVFEVPLAATATPGGLVAFEALAVDVVGNERRATRSVVLPPAPVAPQLVLDSGATHTRDLTVAVRFSALNATRAELVSGSTVQAFVATDFGQERQFTLPETGDGEAVVTAVFFDEAGNAVSTSDTIVIDRAAPTLAAPVQLAPATETGDALYVTSVSTTLTVISVDADQMAVVVDGVLDGEVFQPYAGNVVVLLPSGDGPKTVCVHLRDEAGNTRAVAAGGDDDACVDVVLDTTAPTAPVLTTEDGQVLRPPPDGRFGIAFAPLDADVVALRATVEGPFGVAGPFELDVLPGEGLVSMVVPVTSLGVQREETRNLIRVTAVDAAGNRSDQATLTVALDEQDPVLPRIADASEVSSEPPVVVPRQRLGAQGARPPKINADSITLRLALREQRVDRNFDRYELARTEGYVGAVGQRIVPLPLPEDFTDSAGSDTVTFALRQGAPLNGLPGDTPGCSPRACLNHLYIRAVDAAGNRGPMLRVDVIEDSGAPTRPTLSPRSGTLVAADADVLVDAPSTDDGDVCLDDVDCLFGTCVAHACVSATGAGLAVRAYEVKQGTDGAFGGVPGGQPVAGPWRLALTRAADNEVCARGVDEAGNVGIEDCVTYTEAQRALRVASSRQERAGKIAGDYVLLRSEGDVRFADLATPGGPGGPGGPEAVLLEELRLSRSENYDVVTQLVGGRDVVAVAAVASLEGGAPTSPDRGEYVQVRLGASPSQAGDPAVSPITRLDTQLTFRGRGVSLATPRVSPAGLRAIEAAFACGTDPLAPTTSLPTVSIVRARLDLLYAGPVPNGVGDANRNGLGAGGTCPAIDGLIFRRVATLTAGRDLCTNTEPRIDDDATIWCETARRGTTDETGEIKAVAGGTLVTLGLTGTTSHGSLVDGGVGTPIQPLVTPTRFVWAGPDRKLQTRTRSGGVVESRGLVVGELYDADGEEVLYSALRADGASNDGLTDDLYLLDLARSPVPLRLTDDLVPNTDGSLEAGRVAAGAQSSTAEDIEVFTLTDDAWLESGDSLRFTPVTSGSVAAWIDVVDEDLGLSVEDLATGVQITPLAGEALRSQLTFYGGSRSLGRPTHDLGGERMALMQRGAADPRRFVVRIFDFAPALAGIGPAAPAPVVTLTDVATVDAGDVDIGAAAFDLGDDGRVAAWIDADDDGLLRVASVVPDATPALVELFTASTGYATGPSGGVGAVPFVTVQSTPDGAVVVWQEGNAPRNPQSFGDPRSDYFGSLHCAELRSGRRTDGAITRDVNGIAVPLVGRAPDVALTPSGLVLAFSARIESPNDARLRQTSLCMLDCGVVPPRCGPVVPLDLPSTDAGVPAVASTGYVVWPMAVAGTSQIARYDVVRNIRTSLTAPLGDGLARTEVAAAGSAAVWIDTRLGTSDVWRIELP